ncbi:MAG: SDR family oxidoreductase [Rhodobacteraceae bacterium]|nr:SDR family oxidoreductase [Paracoccaceae bacterium]
MQTIVITGAGSGIGRVTAQLFLENGWQVALLGRRLDPLTETADGNDNALALSCDISNAEAVDAAFTTIVERFGRIDALFNNAGCNVPAGTIDEISVEGWQQVINVNLTGSFLCARAAFAKMRVQSPQGGRIINNGSISAQAPRPGSVPYTVSKHAITGLTKTLSLDGRPFDISASQIDIGNALTELSARISKGVTQADGSTKPEPMMQAIEVARAALHIANLPLGTNIPFMTIMATNMPLHGRG